MAKTAWHYTSVMIDPSLLLQYLTKDCQARGVRIVQREISRLEDLFGQHQIVVNCTGLGARKLLHDPLLRPARGVTVRVHAPWVKQFVISAEMPHYKPGEFAHIFPRMNVAVIGGVKHMDDETADTNPKEVNRCRLRWKDP